MVTKEENKPLISVIVPIYNVEKYVRKCLNSLKSQTMKEIEVICIDDGSTDNSGEIADEYRSDEFPIFCVIHTENRGLSAARNRGIDEAKADWIMFVDSDDWVGERFCEIPYEVAKKYGADLVIFRAEKKSCQMVLPVGVADVEAAVRYGDSYPWNKLYRHNLFNGIRYPEGKIYEDLIVTHKILFTAHRIIMIPDLLLYHVYRKNSISQIKSADNKRKGFISALQRTEDLKTLGCCEATYMPTLVAYALGFLAKSYPCDDPMFLKAEEVVDSTKVFYPDLSWKKKAMLVVWKVDKRFFHFLCRIFGQKDVTSKGNTKQ